MVGSQGRYLRLQSIEPMLDIDEDVLHADFPKLRAVYERVDALPQVQAWIQAHQADYPPARAASAFHAKLSPTSGAGKIGIIRTAFAPPRPGSRPTAQRVTISAWRGRSGDRPSALDMPLSAPAPWREKRGTFCVRSWARRPPQSRISEPPFTNFSKECEVPPREPARTTSLRLNF